MTTTRILTIEEVCKITGWSRSSVYRHIELGDLPKPTKLSVVTNGWFSDEIEAWVESKRAERDLEVQRRQMPKRKRGRPLKNPWLTPAT